MAKTPLTKYLKSNRLEILCLSIILLAALVLRLYKIDGFLTFLGDEGRDVRIVRDLLHGNLVFIGPQTSVGNMYLGPLYYYLIAPSLFLANYNPVGPAIFNALLGTLTVGLTWFIGKKWFGTKAALIAAILFAISPVAIIYSRSSWNPNPLPFFALLTIWGVAEVLINKNFKFLPVISISFAFSLQMHYLALLILPIILFSFYKSVKQSNQFKIHTLIAITAFILLMSPLVLFDLKHDFLNLRAFTTFFSHPQSSVNPNILTANHLFPILTQLSSDLVLARQNLLSLPVALIILFFSVYIFRKSPKLRRILVLLYSWLIFSIIGLSLYQKPVYIHYFGIIYPAIYLLLGLILSKIPRILSLSTLLILVSLSLYYSPARETPNYLLRRTEKITTLIIQKSENLPFNFGLIAKQNYDESYRYFFENAKAPLVRGETGITSQLFVVCEDEPCQPENDPAWQIAIFGQKHIVDRWQVEGVKIYLLMHNQPQ